jgi:hypothetical protein
MHGAPFTPVLATVNFPNTNAMEQHMVTWPIWTVPITPKARYDVKKYIPLASVVFITVSTIFCLHYRCIWLWTFQQRIDIYLQRFMVVSSPCRFVPSPFRPLYVRPHTRYRFICELLYLCTFYELYIHKIYLYLFLLWSLMMILSSCHYYK